MKQIILAAAFLLACIPLCAAEQTITLIYTNSLNGYLDYCTCKSDPKGGLVKRATALTKLRREYASKPLLVVDTGDFFPVYSSDLLAPYLIKAFESLHYDAMTFGDQDLDPGIPRFLQMTRNLPLINSNLVFTRPAGQNPFPPYRIIRTNGVTAAVIAIQSAGAYRYTREITRKGVSISAPDAAVRSALAACEKEHPDIVILLSHSGYDEDLSLKDKIPGVSVIVGGHSQTLIDEPAVEGGSCILQAGSNGSHIGICEITFEKRTVKKIKNRFVVPDMNQPADDPFIRSLIREYRAAEDGTSGKFD
jgi:2',3'-cyclic-nucleotide 2'-phosphodiesterase (5'-nucleotidase family)